MINKDTTLCISISAKPSQFGTRFHNYLYQEMGLNFVYKGFSVRRLEDAIRGVRGLGIRGCAVSMPFKEEVIPLLDQVDPLAQRIGAVNTIVNTEGELKGFNTDFLAVKHLIEKEQIPHGISVGMYGSGGMARAVAYALSELGYRNTRVISRNEAKGRKLAGELGFQWNPGFESQKFDFLLNTTPIGMGSASEVLPFPIQSLEFANWVCDVVANPLETPVIQVAKQIQKKVITGYAITVSQAVEQFQLYTGKTPSLELVERAAAFARS